MIRPKKWDIDKDNVCWLLVLKREKKPGGDGAAKGDDEEGR